MDSKKIKSTILTSECIIRGWRELKAMIKSSAVFHGSIVVHPCRNLIGELRLIYGSTDRSRVSVRTFFRVAAAALPLNVIVDSLKSNRWPNFSAETEATIFAENIIPVSSHINLAFFGVCDLSHGLSQRAAAHYSIMLIVWIIGSLRKEIDRKVLH